MGTWITSPVLRWTVGIVVICDDGCNWILPNFYLPIAVTWGSVKLTACDRIGLVGITTYSFRRTALTQMSSAGILLRHIMEISGHNHLGTLQRYLEVSPERRRKAVSVIGF
jgi:integrase